MAIARSDRRGAGHTADQHRAEGRSRRSIAKLAKVVCTPAFDAPGRKKDARVALARSDRYRNSPASSAAVASTAQAADSARPGGLDRTRLSSACFS